MVIVSNKKAYFDYFIEDKHEAGLVLEGWEVKATSLKNLTSLLEMLKYT